ncbi:MAG: polyribonucleotide nucleotidyltransferase [Actinobacteria bacterium]|jgi:polyribonucleotide nucleotidyltransferase|nr:polyribonucleotide nucleotidyltransferase [Actinomycetota bacterium]
MADAIRVSGPVSGTDKTLSFETGKLATQSMGAVVATIGGTTVFATANAARTVRDGIDFFPLTVDVEERAYAAGKIPGAFFRREGRPSEQAILTCRLTDRPLRPAFPDGYRNETQVVLTILGVDMKNPHDVISINAASAAFMVSGIPFEGPIGAVRLAYSQDGKWIPHPTYEEGEDGTFEIVVAGRELDNGDVAIMMVEAGGSEKSFEYYEAGAPKVNETVIADGLEASKTWIKESIALQRQLVASVIATKGPITPLAYTPVLDYTDEVFAAVERVATPKLAHAITIALKADRNAATDAAGDETVKELCGEGGQFAGQEKAVKEAVRSLTKKLVRKRVVEQGIRIDGRGPKDLRPVSSEVGILPTAHGTGLFQRGETQVMNVCTLAMPRMNQMLDTLGPDSEKRYIHHYNMAPWANGETGRVGSPKRREIGHGALAERALLPVVPSQEEFAYAIRLVSEVMSSNGSTSMASVCSSSLSLMDAGVPIKAPVSGIAMGLIYAEGKYLTLTDILGAEDAFGDMDFKVAGTEDAVTALQLDTKIDGIPADVLAAALQQAREARMAILDSMNSALSAPRPEVAATAPKIVSFTIPLDKVGEVIGPKGKVINTIQQETGADIAVSDDGAVGIVTIGSPDNAKVEEAKSRILAIVDPPTAELGAVYNGRVVSITKFGAFVNILPGRDGLVHISKLGKGKRINNVEDVLELGQEIEVRVDDIDDKGKVSLTPVGEGYDGIDFSQADDGGERRERRDRDDRGGRGGDRNRGGRDRDDRGGRGGDRDRGERRERSNDSGDVVEVSFEDQFDSEIANELGDLGPGGRAGGNDRDDRGGRGGDRNRRRR